MGDHAVARPERDTVSGLPQTIHHGTVHSARAEMPSASVIRRFLAIYGVAVLVNYPWERVQAQLYVWPDGTSIPSWLCAAASLIDGLLVVLIAMIGWWLLKRPVWFEKPGVQGYGVMLASGLSISLVIEWATVSQLHWWDYAIQMPLLPGFGIGLVPVLQMLVLPPLIFFLATWWCHREKRLSIGRTIRL
jgi:hypothetical protein